VNAGEQEQVGERAGVEQRKREGRDPAGERREQAGRRNKRRRRTSIISSITRLRNLDLLSQSRTFDKR